MTREDRAMNDAAVEIRFATDVGDCKNRKDDPRLALLAVCVHSQQSAGFKNYIDLREVECPTCEAPGFNTGWGYWRFTCGAETLTCGEPSAPCPTTESK
jgi:hypothetical protein